MEDEDNYFDFGRKFPDLVFVILFAVLCIAVAVVSRSCA